MANSAVRHGVKEAMGQIMGRSVVNDDSFCFEWTGTKNRKGYGAVKCDGKMQAAHRVSWQYANGPIPNEMHVLHSCDNRACTLPDHLFLGSNDDNIMDKCIKDRSGKKLDRRKVMEIKRLLASKMIHTEIAERYGVNPSNITRIATGERWAHVLMKKEKVSFLGA